MTIGAFAIVVAFNPDEAKLAWLCHVLERHAQVIVVDNSPHSVASSPMLNADRIIMGGNAGIAAAQNVGIDAALARGAEAIAFFDQDSEPGEALLPKLIAGLGNPPQGVVAPICIDSRTGAEYPPFRMNRWGWAVPERVIGQLRNVAVDLIISSGSVVAAAVFDKVGLMDEDFFIDYVDLEWCIRCRKAGVPITVISDATMVHSIGNAVVNVGSLTTFIHSPVRAYYRLRNALLLLRKRHVPLLYSLHEIAAALVHHILQTRHSENRGQHIRLGWRALLDGIRGLRGELRTT